MESSLDGFRFEMDEPEVHLGFERGVKDDSRLLGILCVHLESACDSERTIELRVVEYPNCRVTCDRYRNRSHTKSAPPLIQTLQQRLSRGIAGLDMHRGQIQEEFFA